MQITLKGTNLELTEAIKAYAESKVGALERHFDAPLEARVEVEHLPHGESGRFRCEINLDASQKQVARAESVSPDLYAAIDEAIPKLREQLEKIKSQQRNTDRRFRRYIKSIFAWRGDGRNKKG